MNGKTGGCVYQLMNELVWGKIINLEMVRGLHEKTIKSTVLQRLEFFSFYFKNELI